MPGLYLHTSNRLECLADQLAKVLEASLSSPLKAETVVVQSRGMERWLSLELAARRGIWANYRFPFPTGLIRELLTSLLGPVAESPLLSPENLAWRLMALLPEKLEQPLYAPLAPYLHGHAQDDLRLWQLCGRIAATFDQYLVYRHDLLRDWEEGRLQRLGVHEEWQAELWRTLVGGPEGPLHRARLTAAFREQLAADPATLRPLLPERLTLFGVSTLPPLHLEVLTALCALIEVHLFLLNPCEGYWLELRSPPEAARLLRRAAAQGLDAGEVYLEAGHPLLASLGRSGRQFLARLLELESVDDSAFVEPTGATLLSRLQRDLLGRDWPLDWPPLHKHPLAMDDRSLQIHACHGALREVEVLHDLLLAAFAEIPGLAPRDVLVMAPDIEVYAPFIEAAFSRAGRERTAAALPYTIADRGLHGEGELLIAFERLCALPTGRCGAAELLDLLELEPVARRFALGTADCETLRGWIEQVRIRWGLDAAFRAEEGLPPDPACTWQAGLDRLLLGIALPEGDALFGEILPADGGEVALLGALCDFIATIGRWVGATRSAQCPQAWSALLLGVLDDFFAPGEEEGEALLRLRRLCLAVGEEAATGGFNGEVPFAVIRSRLATGLAERSTHGFLSGPITFCTLQPMRSVPFKVIALLGMNDGDFPRRSHPPGFDLMPLKPRPCDPARRDEDRYLFLEALLSARERLLITWQGEDPRDGSKAPPSVVVGELLDALAASFVAANGQSVQDQLVTRHRLQPFSLDYFRTGGPLHSRDPLWHAAVQARLGRDDAAVPAPLFAAPLPPPDPPLAGVSLDELERFLRNPARFFLQQRLQLRLVTARESLSEREPFLLDGLERYGLGQPLVARLLAGGEIEAERRRAVAAGLLPAGAIGAGTWRQLAGEAADFSASVRQALPAQAATIEIDLACAGLRLFGAIEAVGETSALFWRFAALKGKDRLAAWLRHLALSASGHARTTQLLARDGALGFAPLTVECAQSLLAELLDLYQVGLLRPLPFFPESACAYAASLRKDGDVTKALAAAHKVWAPAEFSGTGGEGDDPGYRLVFADEPLGEEFIRLAQQIYAPLFAAAAEAGEEA